MKLGDLLVNQKVISAEQLETALHTQKSTGQKLGQVLIQTDVLTEKEILDALSKQLELPIIDLASTEINHEQAKILPEAYARKFRALVIDEKNGTLQIAMCDPLDLNAIDELKFKLNHKVSIVLVSENDLLNALDIIYRRSEEISALAVELQEEFSTDAFQLEDLELDKAKVDAPVVKFLRSIFEDAMQAQASDIHIEPDKNELRIRLRVFGLLQEQIVKEKEIAPAIALRLKLMAGLNISEKRLPQDGRFNIKIGNKLIDVRLSTLPTQHGESVVMRLLDQSTGLLDIKNSGMNKEIDERFRKLIHIPNGIILVTGPTGSGKSTTLYAALNELNSSEKKIITAEDPIEYELPRVNQVQVNEKVGLTFAKVLRSVLRQDPDIVLVGEMRDEETAEIAVRAALTGHLVLSTLHTNDAASTVLRLMDMDLEGFLLSATVRGILAQRLIRKICSRCAKPYQPSKFENNWLKEFNGEDTADFTFKIGSGCPYCNHCGFSGRAGIFELLELDEDMAEALRKKQPEQFMKLAKAALKGKLLIDCALDMAKNGVTSISEIFHLAGEEEIDASI